MMSVLIWNLHNTKNLASQMESNHVLLSGGWMTCLGCCWKEIQRRDRTTARMRNLTHPVGKPSAGGSSAAGRATRSLIQQVALDVEVATDAWDCQYYLGHCSCIPEWLNSECLSSLSERQGSEKMILFSLSLICFSSFISFFFVLFQCFQRI